MKILAIRVNNLASLEGICEIDFTKEPLRSAGIFAITGPTGAGKSTLLDALCLALFANTPRLTAKESGIEILDVANSKINPGDIRSILRKGCGQGSAEVEFVGIDECRYRSTWTVRRARNQADGSLQQDTVELLNMDTNTRYPEKKTETLKEIERLIGLNFNQFTRSVLLAQGEFTAFMKANKDEKASLLEKLTGTDIYSEISKRVYENFKRAEQELNALKVQIENIPLFNEAELGLLNQQICESDAALSELKKTLDQYNAEIGWHSNLAGITANLQVAVREWNSATETKEQAAERIVKLETIGTVHGARTLFDAKLNVAQQSKSKIAELGFTVAKTATIELELADIALRLAEAENALSAAKNASLEAQPYIEKARETDTIISQKTEQLALAEQDLKIALNKRNDHKLKISDKTKESLDSAAQLSILVQWIADNEFLGPIATNLELILSKLDDVRRQFDLKLKLQTDLDANISKFNQTAIEIQSLGEDIAIKTALAAASNSEYAEKKKQLDAVDIQSVKESEASLHDSFEQLTLAKGSWELLYATQRESGIIQEKLTGTEIELLESESGLEKENIHLRDAKIQKEQSQKTLSRAELEAAENIETLRSQLTDHEPCPLCGSLDHPYSLNNPRFHKVLENLRLENKEYDLLYENALGKCKTLEQKCTGLKKERIELEQERIAKNGKLILLTEEWNKLNLKPALYALADTEKSGWLVTESLSVKNRLNSTRGQLANQEKLKLLLEAQKERSDKQEKELVTLNVTLSDKNKDLSTYNTETIRLNAELVECKKMINEITGSIAPFFINPSWLENWISNAGQFEEKLKYIASEWLQKNERTEKIKSGSLLLKTEIAGLQNQLAEFENHFNIAFRKQEELTAATDGLVRLRKTLFEGLPVEFVLLELNAGIEKASLSQKGWLDAHARQNDELIKYQALKVQLEIDMATLELKAKEQDDKIASWINSFNSSGSARIDESLAEELLKFTPEWISTERKALDDINNALTRTKATCDERNKQLSMHMNGKISDRTIEEIRELLDDSIQKSDQAVALRNEIDFKLRQDRLNKHQVGSIIKEIESQSVIFGNWQKLNDLIGSADGKKFRQIAQEYTLDFLLAYANEHLRFLSDRYELARIPSSLALQVLDKEMGDEIRSVNSLSGGESFLVSLALALGLASLSSNRMKVESLFIDEGFGSLDPATLNIAMDALDRLQNQGRKVGVISHVQEMNERIGTRIRVNKLSNGRSRVEVVG
jgi:exonuclease SbcC